MTERDADVHITVTTEQNGKKRTLYDTVRSGDYARHGPDYEPIPGALGLYYSDYVAMCVGEKKKITKELTLRYIDGKNTKEKQINIDVVLDVIGTDLLRDQLEVVNSDGRLVAITEKDVKCMACRGLMDLWAQEWAAPAPGKEEASLKENRQDLGKWMARQPKWHSFCSSDRVTHRSISPVMRKICQRILRSSKKAILDSFAHVNPTDEISSANYMNAKDVVCGQTHRRYCGADFSRITTEPCTACVGVVDGIRKELFVTAGLPYDGYTDEQIKPVIMAACDHLHENHYEVPLMQDACSELTDVDMGTLVETFKQNFMNLQALVDGLCRQQTALCRAKTTEQHMTNIVHAHVTGSTWAENFTWETHEQKPFEDL